jgi:hypothetical protein
MTHKQRAERIRTLSRELVNLLEEEGAPKSTVKFLSAADLPAWLVQGLRNAIRRKLAEESPIAH